MTAGEVAGAGDVRTALHPVMPPPASARGSIVSPLTLPRNSIGLPASSATVNSISSPRRLAFCSGTVRSSTVALPSIFWNCCWSCDREARGAADQMPPAGDLRRHVPEVDGAVLDVLLDVRLPVVADREIMRDDAAAGTQLADQARHELHVGPDEQIEPDHRCFAHRGLEQVLPAKLDAVGDARRLGVRARLRDQLGIDDRRRSRARRSAPPP